MKTSADSRFCSFIWTSTSFFSSSSIFFVNFGLSMLVMFVSMLVMFVSMSVTFVSMSVMRLWCVSVVCFCTSSWSWRLDVELRMEDTRSERTWKKSYTYAILWTFSTSSLAVCFSCKDLWRALCSVSRSSISFLSSWVVWESWWRWSSWFNSFVTIFLSGAYITSTNLTAF